MLVWDVIWRSTISDIAKNKVSSCGMHCMMSHKCLVAISHDVVIHIDESTVKFKSRKLVTNSE